MSRYDELTGLVEGMGNDFAKFYGKGNKARRRAGLNVKEREYPTKMQKSLEDSLGFKALSENNKWKIIPKIIVKPSFLASLGSGTISVG